MAKCHQANCCPPAEPIPRKIGSEHGSNDDAYVGIGSTWGYACCSASWRAHCACDAKCYSQRRTQPCCRRWIWCSLETKPQRPWYSWPLAEFFLWTNSHYWWGVITRGHLSCLPCAEASVMKVNIVLHPRVMRGGAWSACSQKDTHDMATISIDGRK